MGTPKSKDTHVRAQEKSWVTSKMEAERVVSELRDAFRSVGIVLPSLCVDPAGYCNVPPVHLVDLGRINFETANKLIAVLGRYQFPKGCSDTQNV
jgi:hypothetical protein